MFFAAIFFTKLFQVLMFDAQINNNVQLITYANFLNKFFIQNSSFNFPSEPQIPTRFISSHFLNNIQLPSTAFNFYNG